MTNQVSNRTQRRLANHLCLNVLKAMKYHAIIAYSFVSKKALALVQSLHLPIKSVRIIMKENPVIELEFRNDYVSLEFEMGKNYKQIASLNDLPLNVNVFKGEEVHLAVTMSNQGMALREWIQHLCSISNKVKLHEAEFHIGDMQFDVQSLRNAFPKLRNIGIHGSRNETSEHETLNAQIILRAFLPYVKEVELISVNLGENLTCEHIGIANLKNLDFVHPKNFNFDCIFTLNAESCNIITDQIPLRDLNRFFKLWVKQPNPRRRSLMISCDMETVPDWNVLLKGLKFEEIEKEAEEDDEEVEEDEEDEETGADEDEEEADEEKAEDESESETESDEELEDEEVEGEGKKFLIRNCRGIHGQIEVKLFEGSASVKFIVSKGYS
ncbi:Protein CBG20200 [Caenorhabditis briggsae]|uniref:Protein CBG20200 n=1 Tax=Caenorhabditis briggsae TaxID=6238 RepID=A8XX77_CAEBR|nr:Protein CBG20200 [Caenorhabditis briggsae]CAP37246.1 Protein CBG20200 [Caenorhabditis briggsae]